MASAEGAVRFGIRTLLPSTTMNGPNLPNGDCPPLSGKEAVLTSLMDKLKTTSEQVKSWSESSRKLRQAVAKYKEPDSVDPNRLQKCLESLKKAIKVTSLHSMGDRLQAMARQSGLKFSPGPTGTSTNVFISSDMFYVEVMMDNSGNVKDVKVAHHQHDPQSCQELKVALKKNEFKEFSEHLKELNQLYQLPMDNNQKAKAFMSLQALETDVATLFQMQGSYANNPLMIILKGPVGYFTPRSGGRPAQVTYYVSPYDLLNVETGTTTTLTMKEPVPRSLGFSVYVTIESSTLHKLQTTPLLSVPMSADGKRAVGSPSFIQLGNPNSTTLPASFILKLNKPMPLSTTSIRQVQAHTGMQFVDLTQGKPLNGLICQHYSTSNQSSGAKSSNYNTFFVNLPDQHHCYFINECSCGPEMKGVILSKMAFTHPANIPQIVMFLRQQAVYNTLIASCVRNSGKQDIGNCVLFDVTPVTPQRISVSFEHPIHEGMACVEFDLSELANVKCKLHTPPGEQPLCSDEYATKVLQRCMSIPVTMRSILKKAADQRQMLDGSQRVGAQGYSPYSYSSGDITGFIPNAGRLSAGITVSLAKNEHSSTSGGQVRSTTMVSSTSGLPLDKSISVQRYKHALIELPSGAIGQSAFGRSITVTNVTTDGETGLGPIGGVSTDDSKVTQNPMLATLLQTTGNVNMMPPEEGEEISPGGKGRNPMLMNLLQDQGTPLPSNVTQPQQIKPTRKRKRKSVTERSPKRQASEEEFAKELTAIEFDFDLSGHSEPPTLTTSTVSDPIRLQTISSQSSSPFRMEMKSDFAKTNETEVSSMLSDIVEQNAKLLKRTSKRADSSGSSRTGQSPKRVSTPTDVGMPKLSNVNTSDSLLGSHGDVLSTSGGADHSSQEHSINTPGSPMDSDLFSKPDNDIFNPGDFMTDDPAPHNPDNDADFTEPIDFNTEVLNPSNFPTDFMEPTTESSVGVDLDTCDATAFGFTPSVGKTNPAANTTTTGNTTPSSTDQSTVVSSSSTKQASSLDKSENEESTETKERQPLQTTEEPISVLMALSDEALDLSMPPKTKSPLDSRDKEESVSKPTPPILSEPPVEVKHKRSEHETGRVSKKGKKRDSKKGSDFDGESSSSKRKQESKRERSSKRRKGEGSRSPSRGRKSPTLSGSLPPVTVTIPKLNTPTTTMTAKQTAPLKTTIRTVTITSDGQKIKKPVIIKPVAPPSSKNNPSKSSKSSSQDKSSQRNSDGLSNSKGSVKTVTIKPVKRPPKLLPLKDPVTVVTATTLETPSSSMNTATTSSTSNANTTLTSSGSSVSPMKTPTVTSPLLGNKQKSPIRSRKGSLSAVIDKLKESASSVNVKSSALGLFDPSSEKDDDGREQVGEQDKKSTEEMIEKRSDSKTTPTKHTTQKIVTAQNIRNGNSTPTSSVKPILVVRTVAVTTISMTPPTTVLAVTTSAPTGKVKKDRRAVEEPVVSERESPESPEDTSTGLRQGKTPRDNQTPASPDKNNTTVTDLFVPVIPLELQDEKPPGYQREGKPKTESKHKETSILAKLQAEIAEKQSGSGEDRESGMFWPSDDNEGELDGDDENLPYLIEMETKSVPSSPKDSNIANSTDSKTDQSDRHEFKVPTPINVRSATPDVIKKPHPSPGNESDEDDGLVIDVPHTPKSKPDSKSSDTQTETEIKSPRSVMAQSPLGVVAKSPLMVKSPATKSPSNISISGTSDPSHHSTTGSPCTIDDELMDEALLYKD